MHNKKCVSLSLPEYVWANHSLGHHQVGHSYAEGHAKIFSNVYCWYANRGEKYNEQKVAEFDNSKLNFIKLTCVESLFLEDVEGLFCVFKYLEWQVEFKKKLPLFSDHLQRDFIFLKLLKTLVNHVTLWLWRFKLGIFYCGYFTQDILLQPLFKLEYITKMSYQMYLIIDIYSFCDVTTLGRITGDT